MSQLTVRNPDFEAVVRGYLIGSGWKDYQETGKVCGIALPAGLTAEQRSAIATGFARGRANAKLALETANRGYVMESGEITLQGPARALLDDPKVRQAYLGEG